MTEAQSTGRDSLTDASSTSLFGARLAVGLIQGVALWWLAQWGNGLGSHLGNAIPQMYWPLLLIFAFLPIVLLGGLGRMRSRTLALWIAVAIAVLAVMGWHDIARQGEAVMGRALLPSFATPLFAAALLFIGHHLVLPADRQRGWIAPYPGYFDTAWKAGVQLILAKGFTIAFWILLFLGASLFKIIGLSFLLDLITKSWFFIPAICLAFAVAVHLTDVRDGLIRGVRTVVLTLLSWLLLVMTVLAGGFLAALPFTGLEGLWNTGSATVLVLVSAAILIILINAAYQDGRTDNLPPKVLQAFVRVASVLLVPLIAIAIWALGVRINQHGLTPDRVAAAACALVGAAYAVGYTHAALRPFWTRDAGWMRPLERTNVATAVLIIATILVLFTPILDPARISVANQISRLERGAITPERFDYNFLKFGSGAVGKAALERLAGSNDPDVASRARNAEGLQNRWSPRPRAAPDTPPVIEAVGGGALAGGFMESLMQTGFRHQCAEAGSCVARMQDLDGDGAIEVLLVTQRRVSLWARSPDGTWRRQGDYNRPHCQSDADDRSVVSSGAVAKSTPRWPTLAFGDGPPRQLEPDRALECRDQISRPSAIESGPVTPRSPRPATPFSRRSPQTVPE